MKVSPGAYVVGAQWQHLQLDIGTLPSLRPFLLGKSNGAVNMLAYTVYRAKITGEWQKFMYNAFCTMGLEY